MLHRDGSWSHEGQPVLNRKLRAAFDRSVRYLPGEQKYVVQIAHFRGQIEVEEAGFFVRSIDFETGEVSLSDGSREAFDVSSLRGSKFDEAWLCSVKPDLVPGGIPARLSHAAQSELGNALEEDGEGWVVAMAAQRHPLPDL